MILRTWIIVGILLVGNGIFQLADLGQDMWSGLGASIGIEILFGLALYWSALKHNHQTAKGLFRFCLGVLSVYSLAFALIVRIEFGVFWLMIDVLAMAFSAYTLITLYRGG